MPKVVLKGFIRVSPGDLNLVREHLKDHIRLTRGEPGCLVFNVSQRKDRFFDFSTSMKSLWMPIHLRFIKRVYETVDGEKLQRMLSAIMRRQAKIVEIQFEQPERQDRQG